MRFGRKVGTAGNSAIITQTVIITRIKAQPYLQKSGMLTSVRLHVTYMSVPNGGVRHPQ